MQHVYWLYRNIIWRSYRHSKWIIQVFYLAFYIRQHVIQVLSLLRLVFWLSKELALSTKCYHYLLLMILLSFFHSILEVKCKLLIARTNKWNYIFSCNIQVSEENIASIWFHLVCWVHFLLVPSRPVLQVNRNQFYLVLQTLNCPQYYRTPNQNRRITFII